MKEEPKKEKSRGSMVIDGEVDPVGREKGWINLRKRTPINQRPKEEQIAICRKGQKAQREIYGKKKTARESIEQLLSIKVTDEIMEKADLDQTVIDRMKRSGAELTFYDLVNIVAIGRAIGGSVNAMQYVRDTNGDKPTDKVEMTTDIMTDSDRELLKSIADRMSKAESIHIVESDG